MRAMVQTNFTNFTELSGCNPSYCFQVLLASTYIVNFSSLQFVTKTAMLRCTFCPDGRLTLESYFMPKQFLMYSELYQVFG